MKVGERDCAVHLRLMVQEVGGGIAQGRSPAMNEVARNVEWSDARDVGG